MLHGIKEKIINPKSQGDIPFPSLSQQDTRTTISSSSRQPMVEVPHFGSFSCIWRLTCLSPLDLLGYSLQSSLS